MRVLWYRGADKPGDRNGDVLGLYTAGGGRKQFLVSTCRNTHSTVNTDGTAGDTHHNADMADYYNELRYDSCY